MDTFMGVSGLLAFFNHFTVSYREAPWLPRWLGQGRSRHHVGIHFQVAISNAYYGMLMLWLAWGRIPELGGWLQAMLTLAGLYTLLGVGAMRAWQGGRILRGNPPKALVD